MKNSSTFINFTIIGPLLGTHPDVVRGIMNVILTKISKVSFKVKVLGLS